MNNSGCSRAPHQKAIAILRVPRIALVALMLVALCNSSRLATAADPIEQGFFIDHCHDCHSGESAEAGFRLDTLGRDLQNAANERRWQKIYDKLASGQMPPTDAQQPSKQQRESTIKSLGESLRSANLKRRGAEGRVVLRRLNRFEYENTLQDLLDIDLPLAKFLPEDATADGFNKVASALRLSAVHMEQYMAAAGAAIDAAIIHEPAFAPVREKFVVASNLGSPWQKLSLILDDGVVLFGGSPDPAFRWKAPAQGKYRFKLFVKTFQSTKPLTCGIRAGDFTRRTGINHLVGYYDIEPGAERAITFEASIYAGESIRFNTFGIDGKAKVKADGTTDYKGPGIWLGPLEIEGPAEEPFPPESHRRLFDDLLLEPVEGKFNPMRSRRRQQRTVYHAVHSANPKRDAERLIRRFAEKAYRRPVEAAELRPYLSLVVRQLDRGKSFEQALRHGYIAILCSSDFLFVTQPRGEDDPDSSHSLSLDAYELASRLSYFLWSSAPDEELLSLAKSGTLNKPAVLRQQVDRMLADRKSRRFVNDFVDQWLDLKLIDFTTPDRRLYADFDDLLKVSMVEETRQFFRHILEHDLSVSNFIDSDFAIINERLATHYGLDGVVGQEFRRVTLPKGSHRGGVLTHASVLKVTADGTRTSPILRGVWALERILGKPVPPPPPGVPSMEPDIRGATTIREQLAKHRQAESCDVCHRHIDPLGFAMESYDVIGGWREQYRASRTGRVVRADGYRRQFSYRIGTDVESADQLHDGRKFTNMDELKSLLAKDNRQTAHCVTEKLVTYATGCGVEFADRPAVEAILEKTKQTDYGLKSIVHAIVQSDLFRNK